jgi:glycosyltransferase involved in cell wall biosynthesis
MAAAIVTLLEDPALRARMGAAGLARARQRFSAERMVKDTLRVYQRVALHPHREEDAESLTSEV